VKRISVVPHWHVGSPYVDAPFSIAINAHRWALGLVVHTWGLRVLFFAWHLCIHWGRR